MFQIMVLFSHTGIQVLLNKWKRTLLFLLGCNSLILPDLTGQINKESSRYPVAQGSLGDVWKCTRQVKPPQLVAVKCLRIDIADDCLKKMFTERLEHELQQNTQLKHRNLLPLIGITRGFGSLPAIVSPWMHNGSLTMLLDRDFQHLTIIRMLQILRDIASALQYLHSKDIAHGDLTGNNILIDEKGNAFVADHGILAFCSELSGASYITSNVRWTAPENFRISEDEEPISPPGPQLAPDIYSFGCVMLQVFTGRVPYSECRSDHQVVVQILRGKTPVRPLNPIGDTLWDFTQKCWLEAEHRPLAKEVFGFIHRQLQVPEGKP
ncbi:kinase-like protein [Rhizopogon salebrosus TDB-379]|nr:kinase-like protein [Rhizopogon salebrosus TDB-379]